MRRALLVEEVIKMAIRQQIDADELSRLPVAGNLQYRRPGQPAVGKEQVFPEDGPVFRRDGGRHRHPGKHLQLFEQRLMQGKRH